MRHRYTDADDFDPFAALDDLIATPRAGTGQVPEAPQTTASVPTTRKERIDAATTRKERWDAVRAPARAHVLITQASLICHPCKAYETFGVGPLDRMLPAKRCCPTCRRAQEERQLLCCVTCRVGFRERPKGSCRGQVHPQFEPAKIVDENTNIDSFSGASIAGGWLRKMLGL